MGKRQVPFYGEDGDYRHSKRQRVESGEPRKIKHEEVTSARQLQYLLAFQQDRPQQLRYGIQSFKVFLDTILYSADSTTVEHKRSILEEFLKAQKPRHANKDHVFLPDVFQAWSFASANNSDNLVGAVSAVLALLLKLLSSKLDLREYGVSLCEAVLQFPQLKLIKKSLDERYKDFVVSPVLRLLTEVVSFDGGIFAKRLYANRSFTFDPKELAQQIGSRRSSQQLDPTKPSVRSNAVRYLLANLRYQNEGAKMDILGMGSVSRSLLAHVHDDPPSLVRDILYVLKTHVVLDQSIDRKRKTYFLDDRNLSSILSICRRGDEEEDSSASSKPIQDLAYEFLLLVCTTPNLGVHLLDDGWYPPGVLQNEEFSAGTSKTAMIDLGLDGLEWFDGFRNGIPVKNTTLASFIQILRPYASQVEQRLLLAIFQAAPELVADYFLKKTNFSFYPNLTATWIGYSSFLFSVAQLPAPKHFGRNDGFASVPPPVSIAIESIIPLPLTQKILTKCLNQSSELISFFAVRLLTASFHKLTQVLEMFRQASMTNGQLWQEGRKKLVEEFCQRCPKMKDVVNLFRRVPESKPMQREAITRLLSRYYEVLPQIALEQHFDVAVPLTNALQSLDLMNTEKDELFPVRLITLDHLLEIARYTPNMQWWKKPEILRFSPFGTLIRLAVTSASPSRKVLDLLETVVKESSIFQSSTATPGLSAMLASLKACKYGIAADHVFDFLDLCLSQFVRKPMKYEDDIDAIVEERKTFAKDGMEIQSFDVSLCLATFAEQLPFVERSSHQVLKDVTEWLALLLNFLRQAGEDSDILTIIRYRMCRTLTATDCIATLDDCFDRPEKLAEHVSAFVRVTDEANTAAPEKAQDVRDYKDYFVEHGPPKEDSKHLGLTRWTQKEVEEAIENGHAQALILCLSSADQSIRLQALAGVRRFADKVEESDHIEKAQVFLLLKELLETLSGHQSEARVPYLLTTFASHALAIEADPGHDMYPKMNVFLNRGPSWNVAHLPSLWEEKIFREEPSEDDAHWREVEWFLDWLFDGIRTVDDLEILRKCGTFERLMTLYGGSFTSKTVREKVRRIMARTTWIDGGSTTLVTRSGVLAWLLAMARKKGGGESELLKATMKRIWETCDKLRVGEWSKGEAERWVETMSR